MRKTTEQFIRESLNIHGNKYDYSTVDYINARTKVKIICKKHGVFEQNPQNHLRGNGCKKCANNSLFSNKEIFINKSINIHGNKYDYSKVNYIKNNIKIKIICKTHGIFEQTPQNHLNGQGCFKCFNENQSNNTKNFIKQSINIHGNKYDYSKVNYKNNRIKVKIICKTHGIFNQSPITHLNGGGCRMCHLKNLKNKMSKKFLNKSKLIHDFKYDYSKVDYKKSYLKIKIICPIHGDFEQTPQSHLRGHGCPICKSSKGEKVIRKYLRKNKIKFIIEKRFNDCRNKLPLPFDFYLPEQNLCIEFDGKHHYEEIEYYGENAFKNIKINDNIKNKYCKEKGIKLLRIKYDENIELFLNENLPNLWEFDYI